MSSPYHVALEMSGEVIYCAQHDGWDNDFWCDGLTVKDITEAGDHITEQEWALLYCSALINMAKAVASV